MTNCKIVLEFPPGRSYDTSEGSDAERLLEYIFRNNKLPVDWTDVLGDSERARERGPFRARLRILEPPGHVMADIGPW